MDYCAGADALTFAPEGFIEFFNQRRRWVTSTLANQLDLMSSYTNTVYINDNISKLFMMYQMLLTISTVLGPATIIIAISSAFKEILHTHQAWSYILAIVPIAIYILICHVCKEKTQLMVAGFLSAVYAGVMVVVLVGILKSLANDDLLSPSLFFVMVLGGCFITGAILHPYEFFCLPPGILYYLCIPAGYLILIIYSFSNLHVVSWGTRETPKPAGATPPKKEEKKKNTWKFLSFLRLDKYYKDFKQTLVQIVSNSRFQQQQLQLLQEMNRNLKKMNKTMKGTDAESEDESNGNKTHFEPVVKYATKSRKPKPAPEPEVQEPFIEDPEKPVWTTEVEELKDGRISSLPADELEFWNDFIKKYEKPLKDNAKTKAELQSKLIELRNNVSFAVWFINGLWVLFNYMMESALPPIPVGPYKTPPLGFFFLIIFFLLLILQLIGMIIHRWGTFLQLIANTELPNPWRKSHKRFESQTVEEAIRITKEMQRRRTFLDLPAPDYNEEEDITFRQFLNSTVRGRRKGPHIGWSSNLERTSRKQNEFYDEEAQMLRPILRNDTVSKGVARSLAPYVQPHRRTISHGGDGYPSIPKRYLQHNELEKRFEKRFQTLSRRYRDVRTTFTQNIDI